jgi:hypothetical protein
MNTKANKRIAIAALGAPVLAAIAVGLAAPAWAGSEQVEPSQPAEVGEAGMWSMPREVQEQAAPNINVVLPKPDTNPTLDQCTVIRHDGFDPAQPPASNGVSVEAFC